MGIAASRGRWVAAAALVMMSLCTHGSWGDERIRARANADHGSSGFTARPVHGSSGFTARPCVEILAEPAATPEGDPTDYDAVDALARSFDQAFQNDPDYAGSIWAAAKKSVIVRFKSPSEDSRERVANIVALHDFPYPLLYDIVQFTSAEQRRLADDILERRTIDGLTIASVSNNIVCESIEVVFENQDSFDSALVEQAAGHLAEAYGIDVTVERPTGAAQDRRLEEGAVNGGVAIQTDNNPAPRSENAHCTGGLFAHRGAAEVLTTAGHCGDVGLPYYSIVNAAYLGTVIYSGSFDFTSGTQPDVAVMAYANDYGNSIWWGERSTTELRLVTAKASWPTEGTPIWFDGANGGLVPGSVLDNNEYCYPGGRYGTSRWPTVYASTWGGEYVRRGDSGAPVGRSNSATSSGIDIQALGTISCSNISDRAWYTRIGTIEAFGNVVVDTN